MENINPDVIIEKVKDLIQSNIYDVNNTRRSKKGKWVHTDFPRLDAQTPRISVFIVSAPADGVGIGTFQRRQVLRFQVSIFVKSINSFRSPTEPNKMWNAERVANYLSNEIVQLINGNAELIGLGAKEPVFVDETLNNVNEMVQRNLDFECWVRRDSLVNED